jgi:hypothetical protein
MPILDTDSFIADVYIDIAPRHKAWLQDLSPYLADCARLESALLPWEELAATDQTEFRTLDKDSQLRSKKKFASQFPVELQSMQNLEAFIQE